MKYSCFTNLHYFCCIAKWISYTDTHILFFWISFPFRWSQSILLYSRFSCVTYFIHNTVYMGLPWWLRGKEFDCNLETEFDSQVGKIPWRRAWQPTPVFLPGESPLRGAWRATVLRVATSDTTEVTSQQQQWCMHLSPNLPFISPPLPQTLLPLAAIHLFSTSVSLFLLCK